jgi:EAL domain-containing protein (putative c-di-GMP-specific phosphodiesterase class I)
MRVIKGLFLESIAADGTHLMHVIERLPFRIGREADNDLAIEARGLSRHHAVMTLSPAGEVLLTDLNSTNGTHLNRTRLTAPQLLMDGDVLHFGNAEFRFGAPTATMLLPAADDQRTTIVSKKHALSSNFVREERQFRELLAGKGLSAAAQPIVQATGSAVHAYELLGRCEHPELRYSPIHLFKLAATLDLEVELSSAFRRFGVQAVAPQLKGARLFVNAHPLETFTDAFFDDLQALRHGPGQPALVLEVHESAVVEVPRMRELAARLKEIGVLFAYDDFGAGQARLNELWEVPAHYVKFDMGLIRGIHEASEAKRRGLHNLVEQVLGLGSVPLAEGVEEEAEAAVCREMGFQLIQGYLTGRPVPAGALRA